MRILGWVRRIAVQVRWGNVVEYLLGQLAFLAVVAALVGGVVWAIVAMRKPRPPHEEVDDDDEW